MDLNLDIDLAIRKLSVGTDSIDGALSGYLTGDLSMREANTVVAAGYRLIDQAHALAFGMAYGETD